MKVNPQNISTNIWFNERMNRWNWVLILDNNGITEMYNGTAPSKQQSKYDINRTLIWIDEKSRV